MKKLLFALSWICLISAEILAQNHSEIGFPAISNFSPKEYDAFRQNWAIAQDDRGIMYFGNTDGLLEYDGNSWQLYTIPNKSAILGIAFGEDKKLYVGAQADLGYFLPDPFGQMKFTSLLDYIPESSRDFSNVTEIHVNQGKVFFNSEKYLLIWDIEKREFQIIPSENGFHILFKVNENIYVREWGVGLKIWENNKLTLVQGGELFANERIYSLLPFIAEPESLLLVTRTMGIFKYVDSTFIPFETEVQQFIKENLIYLPGTVLQDGNMLLNTLNGGSILIDQEGNEVARYNHEIGIINNTVYFSYQDKAGGIWLATENGISRIDYASPISYFDSRSGITTYSHDIIRHEGTIYAGTANGIFTLDPSTSIFHQLNNFNKQSWTFLEVEDDLLIGSADGLFKIKSGNLIPIKRTIENEFLVNELIQSSVNPSRIFVGVNSGIWSMVKNGPNWVEEGQILEVFDQPTSLQEDENGNLWMGTFSNGLFKVSFPNIDGDSPLIQDAVIENYDDKNGLQDGIVYAKKLNGKMYFGTTDSIYQYDESENRFLIDTTDNLVATFYELKANQDRVPLTEDLLGRVWLGNKKTIAIGEVKEETNWEWTTFPFRRISDEAIYSIYAEKNGLTWFASGEGFIRYDFGKKNSSPQEFTTLIRAVSNGNDSIIALGGNQEYSQIPELKFKNNALKFRFAATSYERKNANQFSTFLEGFDDSWSPWSVETQKTYTNLSPGEYTFQVKGTNLLGYESPIASYSFIILPPWYRTWWAYLIYAFLLGNIIVAIVQIRAYYLKKENRILEEKVQHRTKQLKKSIEDLKAAQAQLIQAEKMASLGELTAGIAHEIQNPLNFVNNFSELNKELIADLKEEIEKGDLEEVKLIADDIESNEEKINNHGKRAGAIVKGMLEHSRSNSGEKTLTDLNALADEYLRLSYHGLRAKDKSFSADFKTDFDPNLPKLEVVSQDIGRVLLNLINNAFYAVNEKAISGIDGYSPEVIVSSKKTETGIEISVKDNG
ncbi:MAG: hypothetical protein HWE09_07275, partial [Cyclobacteriaceae bacterium]|nr:hypothetical protein [Cyclobacteriaceae bacterium]